MGPVEKIIRKKRNLIVISSGALTSLPFQMLVTKKPVLKKPPKGKRKKRIKRQAGGQRQFVAVKLPKTYADTEKYRKAAWLIRKYAITSLPSITSLKDMRRLASASHAPKPLIGFANPTFGEKRTQEVDIKKAANLPNGEAKAPKEVKAPKSAGPKNTSKTRSFSF